MVHSRLRRIELHGSVRGLVLMLHGGQEASTEPVLRRHGSWARMALLQGSLARSVGRRGVAVWLVRNRVRGWNELPGREPDPVRDARAALAVAGAELPDVPVALVGHSMGGRTACAVAGERGVVGVCALAPWLPAGSTVAPLVGKSLVVVHGGADDLTSPQASRDFVARAQAAGSYAVYVEVPEAGHAMLRRRRTWDQLVREATMPMLGLAGVPR